MPGDYYKPCAELTRCLELDRFWSSEEYDKWFEGYLAIAEETGYALAECQAGFAYLEGIGVEKDLQKALYWTTRGAEHGDRDAQCNLAWIYEEGFGVEKDIETAKHWYRASALQDHDLSIQKCKEYGVSLG